MPQFWDTATSFHKKDVQLFLLASPPRVSTVNFRDRGKSPERGNLSTCNALQPPVVARSQQRRGTNPNICMRPVTIRERNIHLRARRTTRRLFNPVLLKWRVVLVSGSDGGLKAARDQVTLVIFWNDICSLLYMNILYASLEPRVVSVSIVICFMTFAV